MNADFRNTQRVTLQKSVVRYRQEGATLLETDKCIGAGSIITIGAPHYMKLGNENKLSVPTEIRSGLITETSWLIVGDMNLSLSDQRKIEAAWRETAAESLG